MNTRLAFCTVWIALAARWAHGGPPLVVPEDPPGLVAQGGTVVSASVAGAGYLLRASYQPAYGSGNLERFEVAVEDGGLLSVAQRPSWSAEAMLPPPMARNIFFTSGRPDGANSTRPFEFARLPEQLRRSFTPELVDWLRGDRTKEGRGLRRRASIIGAIVRSTPLIVESSHAAVVYAGASDGMLHCFDVATGRELFAYVPQALLPQLPLLADPRNQSRAYLDGPAAVGESTAGRKVLASGFGMGATGLFALDVTDPEHFADGPGELWEFGAADDPMMGYVISPPSIARFNVAHRGAPLWRDFVVVSSGVNNDAAARDSDGALFLLALDKPPGERWQRGVNYYRIAAPAGAPSRANALGPLAVVRGANGAARYAYAGDVQGAVWRFDFGGAPPWHTASVLFVARDADGRRQPITSAPAVVYAPGQGYLVMVGTGKLLEARDLDPNEFSTQSFYALHDNLDTPIRPIASRNELVERKPVANGEGWSVTGPPFAGTSARGWFFDYPASRTSGERSIAAAVAKGGAVVVASFAPASTNASASTTTYVLAATSGLSDTATGQRTVFAGAAPIQLYLAGVRTAVPGASGTVQATLSFAWLPAPGRSEKPSVTLRLPAGRLGWREIPNWQALHEATTNREGR